MRTFRICSMAALALCVAAAAHAELQNVTVGGSIRIRGNWYHLQDNGGEFSGVEQRTRLSATADFTEDVTAVIEIDSYDVWGEDFRSNPVTGLDGRAASIDDVEMYQAYIEARNMWGTDLTIRVGRQELPLGSQWLIGVNDTNSAFTGLSWDAFVATYGNEDWSVTGIATKLAETGSDAFEKDTNLYALWGHVNGGLISDRMEDVGMDAYYIYVQDDGNLSAALPNGRLMEFSTAGLRIGGTIDAWDFEAEGAYQFGYIGVEGGQDQDYANWAVNLEGGYTFDVKTTPRLYAGFAMFTGEEDDGELSFNRLFSNWEYSEFLDVNGNLSNAMIYRLGLSLAPTEDLTLKVAGSYFMIHDVADQGDADFFGGRDESSRHEAVELGVYADYAYSDDLTFRAGYAYLITMDGAEEGNLLLNNGINRLDNGTPDDAGYAFIEAELAF